MVNYFYLLALKCNNYSILVEKKIIAKITKKKSCFQNMPCFIPKFHFFGGKNYSPKC